MGKDSEILEPSSRTCDQCGRFSNQCEGTPYLCSKCEKYFREAFKILSGLE